MENRTSRSVFRLLFLLLILTAGIACMNGRAGAQEIMLDKMETCGDLICYPCLDAPERFYYLPDQPRLAYKNGRPQFSFLKYARTQASGKAGTGSARGGGIVHFLVTYGPPTPGYARLKTTFRSVILMQVSSVPLPIET